MAAVAQILIEVDDTAAISAVKAIGESGAKIGPSLAPAKGALDNISKGSKEARESAELLSESLGTKIPRGLRNILSENSLIGPALKAAFSGAVVAGFVTVVKDAVDNLTGFSDALDAINKQNENLLASVGQANKALIGPQNLAQVRTEIAKTSAQIDGLKQTLGLDGGFWDPLTRGLTKYSAANSVLLKQLDDDSARLNELHNLEAKLVDEQRRTEPIEVQEQLNAAREAGLVGIKAINQAEIDAANIVDEKVKANVTTETIGQAQITAIHAKATAERKLYAQSEWDTTRQLAFAALQSALQGEAAVRRSVEGQIELQKTLLDRGLIDYDTFVERKRSITFTGDNQIKQMEIQNANEIAQAQSQAAVALVPPWARSYAQISADTQQRLREIQQALDETKINSEQAAQLAAAAWQVNFARTRDQLAQDMESFFDDITSGNIGQRFKKMFEDLVFQMIATWILGMNSMRQAAATGFGGGPTGILGAILGIGGATGGIAGGAQTGISGLPGVITNWGNVGVPEALGGGSGGAVNWGNLTGLGISAGQGPGIPGGTLPSGASTGAAASGLGGLLAKIFPNGLTIGGTTIPGSLLATGGIALALNGIGRGGVLGALEGAGGGALTGFAVGGPIGAAIGAVIGALASIIGGLFGPHKGDIARIQVMEPLLSAIKQITDSYDVFQTDYNSGITELETLRTNSLAALKKIGGNQVKGNSAATNQRIDAAEAHLKTTEAERQRRAQIDFGAPQFHTGGLVTWGHAAIPGRPQFHLGGEVNANLLVGEGVVNRKGMSLLGLDGLNRLNAGASGSGGGDVHVHIHSIDAKDTQKWLQEGGYKEIWKAARRAGREGWRM